MGKNKKFGLFSNKMDQTIYLRDRGYSRKPLKNNRWKYINNKGGKEVPPPEKDRVNKLRIPPQWINVWISSSPSSAIQVTGWDAQGKKQYIYSDEWVSTQKSEKYRRMKGFMKALPRFTLRLNRFLKEGAEKERVLSAMFKLMMKTNMRVGNEKYAEENNTFGLTTLKKKHFMGMDKLHFTGKSGIEHTISIKGVCPRTREVIQHLLSKCKSKNKEVFPYNPLDMNNFLRKWMKNDYTCKDFRTLFSNKEFIRSFMRKRQDVSKEPSKGSLKRFVLDCIDDSAKKLGHTRSISRKSYISEELIEYCLGRWDRARGANYSKLFDVACS